MVSGLKQMAFFYLKKSIKQLLSAIQTFHRICLKIHEILEGYDGRLQLENTVIFTECKQKLLPMELSHYSNYVVDESTDY